MCCLRDSVSTVTLKDVAKEAEVSVATASRVINGSENVSMSTRSRVLSAIKTLNYAPNSHAIQLRGLRNASPLYVKRPGRDGSARHEHEDQGDLEALRIENKRLKQAMQTLIRDLARWRSLAEDSMASDLEPH